MEKIASGTEIHGFTIRTQIGSGAFSCVYLAQRGDELYALKVVSKCSLSHNGDSERLQRELDAMAYLKHPNIVSLHEFFTDNNNFYLVLDYCPGGELAEYIDKLSSPMREQQAANVFHQIVSAVSFIHKQGVAHRDLKPQNILITKFPSVKISDFGLCGFTDDTKMKTFCGTPCYTAPECLNQVQYEGEAADVWSLGVILYELVTGKHPWDVKNLPRMIKQITFGQFTVPSTVTPACTDLIKLILKVKPKERPTCEQILNHPWMKLAPSKSKMGLNNTLPILRNSLGSFTKAMNRTPMAGDMGVSSPFDENGNSKLPEAPLMLQPKTISRSRSNSFSKTQPIRGNLRIPPRQIATATMRSGVLKRDAASTLGRGEQNERKIPQRTIPIPVPKRQ